MAFQTAISQNEGVDKNNVLIIRNNQTLAHPTNAVTCAKTSIAPTETHYSRENQKIGGALALTALSILPEVLNIKKD